MSAIKFSVWFRTALFLCSGFLNPALAQTDSTSQLLQDTLQTEEVVVEGTKPAQVELAQTLSLIQVDKTFLLQNQGNTFMNTLEKLPGISAIHTGVGISKPVIRGMSFNRVIVSDYGIKQEGQQWGVDHGLELDQYNVQEVEIIKGPVSMMYGSDGIAGVVNIVKPKIPEGEMIRANAILNYRSNNDAYGSSLSLERAKNGFWAKTRLTFQDCADYKVPATSFDYNSYKLPILNNRLKNTASKELDYSLNLGMKKKWGQTSLYLSHFGQKAGFFSGAFGIPRSYQLQDDGNARDIQLPYQDINHLKIVSNTLILLRKMRCEFDFGYQRNLRQEHSLPHAHNQGVSKTNSLALQLLLQTWSYHIKMKWVAAPSWVLFVGSNGQVQTNKKNGYEFLIPNYNASQFGLYTLSEKSLGKRGLWLLGFRWDAALQEVIKTYLPVYEENSDHVLYYRQRSPALYKGYCVPTASTGIAYYIHQNLQVKYNIGTAFRIPTVAELASNGVHHGTFRHELGDSSLQSERGVLQDVLVSYSRRCIKVQLSPFYYYFQNYIYLRPSARFSLLPDAGQIYNYQQGRVEVKGLEAQVEILVWKPLKYTATLEYVWNRNLENGYPLPFTPPISVLNEIELNKSMRCTYWRSLYASFSVQHFSAQERVDRNEKITDRYTFAHFSLSSQFSFGRHLLTLRFQVRNLTDARFLNNMSRYRILNLPEQGRNFLVMLEYVF